ncbi:glycosyltransferase family 2 protein [Oryzifoliimicrobium ureilyticus]|uniref:glycosyltransferase family 2 protein n=1 Tax=Oryzifoliimicrobium ureilyticus TaxID=3113724 RepID=UPI00307607EC
MSEAQPEVSFIIAAYNAQDTLVAAIESALAQRDVTLEVVVADDCSSDSTAEIVRTYPDERVRLVSLAKNGGPSAARNAAFNAARGRWLAVLDSDDAIDPDRMRRLINRADWAGAAVAVDNLRVVRADGTPAQVMFDEADLAATPELSLPAFIRSNALFQTTHNFGYLKPVFRRDFIETHRLRFDENLRVGEDYLFLASVLALGGRCVIEPKPGYDYLIREGSISRVLKLSHIDAMLEGDRTFLARYRLDDEAMRAQAFRTRSLLRGRSFLHLVDAIKRRSLPNALAVALRDPASLKHLGMPISARFARMAAALNNRRRSLPQRIEP